MRYLDQVQRGVDFIEARLDAEIDLKNVSKAAGISHWHFQRIFRALTGETLKTYVRSRRMAAALDSLLGTQDRIIDIAMRAGFDSQEAFSRAFKRTFGLAPHEFRKTGTRKLFLKKVQFDAEYLLHINENLSLVPEIIEVPPMDLVGLQTPFFGIESDKNNIGELLPALWADFLAKLPSIKNASGDICYGVVSSRPQTDELLYTAGMPVVKASGTLVPEGMISTHLTGGRYAKFMHRGPAHAINSTVNYIYSTWLAQSKECHCYGPDLEFYGSDYHPTSNDSVMYYAIPLGEKKSEPPLQLK